MNDKPISNYELDLTDMDVEELYKEHRRRVRSIAALETIIDDLRTASREIVTELDNMNAERNSELGRIKAINAELIKREKAGD